MIRVLLTSFEPFDGFGLNSSLEAGRLVARQPPAGVELDWIVLPVVAGSCVERAWQRVERLRPALVLALGQAAGTPLLRVEERAVNLDDFSMPDNAGNQNRRRPVVPSGPPQYRATLSPAQVVRRLRGGNVPAVVSGSAGSYVCNHLFYGLLHRAALCGWPHQTGFLHLPLLDGQQDRRRPQPTWPLHLLARGVGRAIVACLDPAGDRDADLPGPALGPPAQPVVGQNQGDHGLAHDHEAGEQAGVVPAAGDDLGRLAGAGDGGLRPRQAAGRLDRHAE
jgi:pyroglutamyl-peptidase